MSQFVPILVNFLAITVLVFGLYVPRYHRKDIAVAILSLNVGVMGVATALSSADVTAGLGLGLFGVLSIIRLRSAELSQEEIAYYFTSLALGLLAGFELDPAWVTPALMGLIVLVLFVGDHPGVFAGSRHQIINLDSAVTDEAELVDRLGLLLDADIKMIKVKKVDLVNDTTTVDVRYAVRAAKPETINIVTADASSVTTSTAGTLR